MAPTLVSTSRTMLRLNPVASKSSEYRLYLIHALPNLQLLGILLCTQTPSRNRVDRERQTERETDRERETDAERDRDRDREMQRERERKWSLIS